MYKTVTLRVSEEDLMKIEKLKAHHVQTFKVSISQSQLLRNLINEKYIEVIEYEEKEDLFVEKDVAHQRDMAIIDRLRVGKWGRFR